MPPSSSNSPPRGASKSGIVDATPPPAARDDIGPSALVEAANLARRGDPAALDRLSRSLLPTMRQWLAGLIRERHADVREELMADIAQDSWLQIQRKLDQFKGSTEPALLAWCWRVTFSTCKNHLKKYVRVQNREEGSDVLPEPGEDEEATSGAPVAKSARDLLVREETSLMVRKAVMAIRNDKHRDAVILFFFEEMSQKDIAEVLGATESAVSTWVYRGKKDIEDYLKKEGYSA